jgi:hypothetical protein
MQVHAMVLNIFRVTELVLPDMQACKMGPDYQRRFGIRGAAYRRDRYIEYAARRDRGMGQNAGRRGRTRRLHGEHAFAGPVCHRSRAEFGRAAKHPGRRGCAACRAHRTGWPGTPAESNSATASSIRLKRSATNRCSNRGKQTLLLRDSAPHPLQDFQRGAGHIFDEGKLRKAHIRGLDEEFYPLST